MSSYTPAKKASIYKSRYKHIEAYRAYQRQYQKEYYKNNPTQLKKHNKLVTKNRMKSYWKRKQNKTAYAIYIKKCREYQRMRLNRMKANEPEKYERVMARKRELQRKRYWKRKWKKQYEA